MAWPPPTLPINRTNADQQKDTHPADHNAENLAINDLVYLVNPSELTTYRVTGQNIPHGTWTAINPWSGQRYPRGNDILSTGTGLKCTRGGRYFCEAWGTLPGSAAGTQRRAITIHTTGSISNDYVQSLVAPVHSATQGNNLSVAITITVPPGGIITIWFYQDSGTTLVATGATLLARRLR